MHQSLQKIFSFAQFLKFPHRSIQLDDDLVLVNWLRVSVGMDCSRFKK